MSIIYYSRQQNCGRVAETGPRKCIPVLKEKVESALEMMKEGLLKRRILNSNANLYSLIIFASSGLDFNSLLILIR